MSWKRERQRERRINAIGWLGQKERILVTVMPPLDYPQDYERLSQMTDRVGISEGRPQSIVRGKH
jgi:hypothetical protein